MSERELEEHILKERKLVRDLIAMGVGLDEIVTRVIELK